MKVLGVMQGNLNERQDRPDPQSNVFGSLLTTFGSVEVGGRNFYKLMQQGECVLLYPGGVREVSTLFLHHQPCILQQHVCHCPACSLTPAFAPAHARWSI